MDARFVNGAVAVIASLVLFVIAGSAHAQSTVHVHATSTPTGVWLHERGADAWTDLCAAPCEADVHSASTLGLSLDALHPQPVAPFALTEGAQLRLMFDDHHLVRTYGLIITVIGVVAALTLGIGGAAAWISAGGNGDMTGPVTSMSAGALALAVGLSVGIVLMNEGDRVAITLGR